MNTATIDTTLQAIRALGPADLQGHGDLQALHSAAFDLARRCGELLGQRQNDLDGLPAGLAEQMAELQARIAHDGKQATLAAFRLVNAMSETTVRHLGGRYPDLLALETAVRAESPVAADVLHGLVTAQAAAFQGLADVLVGSLPGHQHWPTLAEGEQHLESGEIWTPGELDGFVYAPNPAGRTWHVRKAYRQGERSAPMFCGTLPECRAWLASFLAEPQGDRKSAMRRDSFQCRCGGR